MASNVETQVRTGLEDVNASLRTLADSTRRLAESAACVVEKELAMTIRISQQLRDDIVSKEALEKARLEPLPQRFREDAHAVVDLFADAGALLFTSYLQLVDGLFSPEKSAA